MGFEELGFEQLVVGVFRVRSYGVGRGRVAGMESAAASASAPLPSKGNWTG